ncbi:endoribonuclease [Arthrobacter crystallopoietes BAB-32]|uniref:Endoribonuclease n=1 Tax=Arthrobacter crystallopoietes BAB-32 TaxID=1246476 RepID=N1V7J6_9MICC|nr:RidA family protein [Arthrobacter crystallopoietes]EMY35979.1 endoribonuclease [Arthrobacter crystallopoietes BAB-32]
MFQATAVSTQSAPPPAGHYSQAVVAGPFVFLAGQTPRTRDGVRHVDKPFAEQARIVLDNLAAVAAEAGASLKDAVKVTVFLKDPSQAGEFDTIYREYLSEGSVPPARSLVQSDLPHGQLEVEAILLMTGAITHV